MSGDMLLFGGLAYAWVSYLMDRLMRLAGIDPDPKNLLLQIIIGFFLTYSGLAIKLIKVWRQKKPKTIQEEL